MFSRRTRRWILLALSAPQILSLAGCDDSEEGAGSISRRGRVVSAFAVATAEGVDREPRGVLSALRQAARTRPNDPNPLIRLGWTYVDRARATRDAGLYRLALSTADAIDEVGGDRDESALLRGQSLHALHRFREAESIARRLVADRGLPMDRGLLGDVLLDRGDLVGSQLAYQAMMNDKPDAHAYMRVAALFHARGELESAQQLMILALKSISPRQSSLRAWALSRLATYRLLDGEAEAALPYAHAAVAADPAFSEGWHAKGRIEVALDLLPTAIESLRRAVATVRAPETVRLLAEALELSGDTAAAAELNEELSVMRTTVDPRAHALFLADRGVRIDDARTLIARELAERRDAQTLDVQAWVLRASGELADARRAIEEAAARAPADARILLHAGIIAAESGDRASAVESLNEASKRRSGLLPSERALLDPFLYEPHTTNVSSLSGVKNPFPNRRSR